MLNPCKPCVCYGAPCEQCSFGYVTDEAIHDRMKKLILEVLAGEKPLGWRGVEDYMRFHPDWRNEFTEEELKIAENKPKTAHWIIEDHGFGGSYYRCSECGESWCDLFHNISMEERCPNCDALINDDEEEYTKYKAPVDKNQKLLETLQLFDGSMEELLFYYINTHSEEFPASRINKLIRTLQDTYIADRINKLENACSVSKERAAYLLKYLDGTMYKTEEAAALAKEAQIANAEAIIKICKGEEV